VIKNTKEGGISRIEISSIQKAEFFAA